MGTNSKIIKIFSYLFLIGIITAILLLHFSFDGREAKKDIIKKGLVLNDGLIFLQDESTPFTGIIQDTLDNKMIVACRVVEGLKNGQYLLFNLKGNLVVSGFMENNKNDGRWEYFYDNGELECIGNFKNDDPSGKWIWFYSNGSKKSEGSYINGKREGKWVKYDNEGYPTAIVNYCFGDVLSTVEISKPKMI